MKFYTNVFQIGNSMLVRGYDNGRHFEDREEFHPTFYVPTKKRSKWKTLDGQRVEAVKQAHIWLPGSSTISNRSSLFSYFVPEQQVANFKPARVKFLLP